MAESNSTLNYAKSGHSVYFEKRKYSRQEIAEILELDPKDKNFSTKVKTRLSNLGFDKDEDFIYTSKEVTILWVPHSYEEKITYLVRLLGIDRQVDPLAFSTFLYRLALDGYNDCNKMPWVERAIWLKKECNINVTDRTLRSWTKKLIELKIITKDTSDYQCWRSTNIDGIIIRTPVDTPELKAERAAYWQDYFKLKEEVQDIADKKERSFYIFSSLWEKYHCKYYNCCSFVFCAWESNPIMRELRELMCEHFDIYYNSLEA